MAGLLDLANISKQQSMQQFGRLADLEQQRNANNDAIRQQQKAQQKQAIGSAIGTGATVAMMANPVAGVAVGGLMLLGSLF